MKIIYKATNNNTVDGRGADDPSQYFINRADAYEATRGKSSYGSNGIVQEIKVFETYKESTEEYQRQLIAQALDKLTPEERRALGH